MPHDDTSAPLVRIGDVAAASGLSVRTLHHYEDIGLIEPDARSDAGHRLYGPTAMARIYRVQLLRRLGLSLDAVARALDDPAWDLTHALAHHRDALDRSLGATARLRSQVDALLALAETEPRLDLSRVAIRGWSFGGYLAALAVLRRPDVFHAAIAGAPVTDWRLYDTHYTERYLGHPELWPLHYDATDLTAEAAALTRPLLLIHGLADDNVVAAHTLALSTALLQAGRPHQVLPLAGVTHMTPQPEVAENLLLLQLAFLRSSLGIAESG